MSKRLSVLCFFLCILSLPILTSAQSTFCNQYKSGSVPPTGYGAAWNVYSPEKVLFLNSSCNSATGSVEYRIGTGNNAHYVYKLGYYYASSWLPFTFVGTFAQGSADWLVGNGSYTNNNAPTTGHFWIGYICQWNPPGVSGWRCGCRDIECTQSAWQLQGVDRSSSGTTSGTTGGTSGGTTGAGGGVCINTAGLTTRTVATTAQLTAALAEATCGTNVRVGAGTYSGNFQINTKCSASSPIVISSIANPTFTGILTLGGTHITVTGLTFNTGSIVVTGPRNRIAGNILRACPGIACIDILETADNTSVDHNEMVSFQRNAIVSNNQRDNTTQGTYVGRNYIHNAVGTASNGHQAFTNHAHAWADTDAVIEFNLLDDFNIMGEGEAISIKSSGNILRGNTLINSRQHLTIRMGNNNLVEGNWSDGSITMWGDNNIARGNIAAFIRAGAGNETMDAPPVTIVRYGPRRQDDPALHALPAARRSRIEDNRAQVVIGAGATTAINVPARDNVVLRNGGAISRQLEVNTLVTAGTPNIPSWVRKLTPNEVGPAAYAAKCP